MALNVSDKITQNFQQPNIAASYGPYPDTDIAMSAITAQGIACAGLTVGITQQDDSIKEYWLQPDANNDLVFVEKQVAGQAGTNAYVHIMYSVAMPDSNDDMHPFFTIGDKYIGICSDNNATAPATYTSYQWARFVGADGGGGGLTAEERAAIVALFQAAAYTTNQVDIEALIDVIENPPISKILRGISVTWVGGSQPTINAGESLDDLKPYLIVTASYDDNTSAAVSNYTLQGTDPLTQGTLQITASYTEGGVTETKDFDVVVSAAVPKYFITNNLAGCTTSNAAATINEGQSYSAQITAANGYTINGATVTITMGGNDITSTAYNSSTGVINIASVTGAVVIAVTAAALVLTGITANFNPPQGTEFYVGDSTDDLKQYLTVVPTYSNPDANSPTEIDANDCTLAPSTLSLGSNTITVTYDGETDDFPVVAIEIPADVTIGPSGIIVGGTSDSYNSGGSQPYCTNKATRAIYYAFDKEIEPGTYEVRCTCSEPTAMVYFSIYSQLALNQVAQQGSIYDGTAPTKYYCEIPYASVATTFTIVVPETTIPTNPTAVVKVVRAGFKIGAEGTTNIPSNFSCEVKMYKQTNNQ